MKVSYIPLEKHSLFLRREIFDLYDLALDKYCARLVRRTEDSYIYICDTDFLITITRYKDRKVRVGRFENTGKYQEISIEFEGTPHSEANIHLKNLEDLIKLMKNKDDREKEEDVLNLQKKKKNKKSQST